MVQKVIHDAEFDLKTGHTFYNKDIYLFLFKGQERTKIYTTVNYKNFLKWVSNIECQTRKFNITSNNDYDKPDIIMYTKIISYAIHHK